MRATRSDRKMAKQPVEATGTLELSLDATALEARATFVAGDGETWTAERLVQQMKDTGIVDGYTPEAVAKAFGEAVAKKSSEPFVVATGTPPGEPVAEKAEFAELTMPEELKEQAERVLKSAWAPQISVERKERIKKQRKVLKKSKLPFVPDKEEIEEYAEEKVSRERVYVDPTVERTGYATADQKIGVVYPKDDGEAGKSVTGELVAARPLADPLFYAGHGVDRRREDLVATLEGIVRVGANWVDVVPFETHDWDVQLSSDSATVYFTFDPGHSQAEPPTVEDVKARIEELGYPLDRLITDEQISVLIKTAVGTNTPLSGEPLTGRRDGSYEIRVSDDKLTAYLDIHKSLGDGERINLKDLGRELKASKITKLDFAKIQADISAFYKSTDGELIDYLLAEGSKPVPGPERSLECSVRFLEADDAANVINHLKETLPTTEGMQSASEFPAEEIEDVGPVEREQLVITVSPEVPGKPGTDVYGQQTPGEAAHEPPMELFENLERKGSVVVATVSGMLHRGWKDGAVLLRVTPHRDGSAEVTVTENKMAALITMKPAFGTGRHLEFADVEEAIKEAGVSSGSNNDLLLRAWERTKDGARIDQLIFARGRHVKEHKSGNLELLLEIASGSDVTIRADGSADFKNLDRITTVTAGTEIARIHPVVEEKDEGFTVTGDKLAPDEAQAVDVEVGPNVEVKDEDGGVRVLTAAVDGELIYADERFEVRAGHIVEGDVDLHSGNVKFPGTVTVTGSVRSGFFVMANGDIQVGEAVEASLLSADGDIVVNQGVKGGAKAVIRTKGTVGLTFAEQATILAVGNVQAKGSIVHCQVKSNGKVRLIGDKGRILGGLVRAREGLETYDLGSERGVKTVVEFGQNYLIADRIEAEEREMEKLKKQVSKLDLAMKAAEREGDKAKLNALHKKKLQMLKLLEKRGLRVFTYRERFEEHHESEIKVTGTLYPGVVVQTHGRTLEVAEPQKNVILTFNPKSGQIDISNPEKKEKK